MCRDTPVRPRLDETETERNSEVVFKDPSQVPASSNPDGGSRRVAEGSPVPVSVPPLGLCQSPYVLRPGERWTEGRRGRVTDDEEVVSTGGDGRGVKGLTGEGPDNPGEEGPSVDTLIKGGGGRKGTGGKGSVRQSKNVK